MLVERVELHLAATSTAEAVKVGNGMSCLSGERSVVLGNWFKPESG